MGSAAASPPPSGNLTQEELKRVAAHRAVEFVEPGMAVAMAMGMGMEKGDGEPYRRRMASKKIFPCI
uniref:Uncharacterized protein n=1 Tax=Zea mays TaxID=4577 RepID=B6UER6_MAIZE|nr:hypothetical protein [Zea mays]